MNNNIQEGELFILNGETYKSLGKCEDITYTEHNFTLYNKTTQDRIKDACQNRLNMMFVNSYRNIEV